MNLYQSESFFFFRSILLTNQGIVVCDGNLRGRRQFVVNYENAGSYLLKQPRQGTKEIMIVVVCAFVLGLTPWFIYLDKKVLEPFDILFGSVIACVCFLIVVINSIFVFKSLLFSHTIFKPGGIGIDLFKSPAQENEIVTFMEMLLEKRGKYLRQKYLGDGIVESPFTHKKRIIQFKGDGIFSFEEIQKKEKELNEIIRLYHE